MTGSTAQPKMLTQPLQDLHRSAPCSQLQHGKRFRLAGFQERLECWPWNLQKTKTSEDRHVMDCEMSVRTMSELKTETSLGHFRESPSTHSLESHLRLIERQIPIQDGCGDLRIHAFLDVSLPAHLPFGGPKVNLGSPWDLIYII